MENIPHNRSHRHFPARNYADALKKWAPLVAGGALAAFGLTRRSKSGTALAAAGGIVALTAATTSRSRKQESVSTVLVNCSPEHAYSFWRNFENLPQFMHHLESVTTNGDRSHWVAHVPPGARVEWDAEISNESENELIAWRSLPGSDLKMEGMVEFRTAPAGRGTFIDARVRYNPPGGSAAHAIAKLLGKDPSFLMQQDLRRFKALIETGEIPTTQGQTHGPRSAKHPLFQALDPDAAPDYDQQRKSATPTRSQSKQQQQRRAS